MNQRPQKDTNKLLRLLDSLRPKGEKPVAGELVPVAKSFEEAKHLGLPVERKNHESSFETSCGKKGWHSEEAAKRGARALLKRNSANCGKLITYHCPNCGHWHLTSRDPSKRRPQKGGRR